MELATITMGLGVMSKLLGAGMKVWDSAGDGSFDKKDLEGLRALVETAGGLVGKRKAKAPEAAALHLALVTRSFGRALGRHQELHGLTAPLDSAWQRWRNKGDKAREKEIELRVKLAAPRLTELGAGGEKELELLDMLSGSPLSTPYYRALWWAFTEQQLTVAEQGDVPPFDLTATAAREFERFFLLEYLRGLTAAPAIAAYLDGVEEYRKLLVRDLLMRELATWGGRHVFGNVTREEWEKAGDGTLPFLALEDQYVEPMAQVVERAEGHARAQQKGPVRPIQELLRELTVSAAAPKVIVVTADFGSGKSLSARTFAWRLACEFLSSAQRSPELWRPAHVRCAEDFSSDRVDLEDTLRRAHKRTAEQAGLAASHEDAAFGWPERDQRFLCLLDGLDEVALGREALCVLFQRLGDKSSDRHRFVVFTRPGVLPEARELGDRVQEVRLLPFEETQIDEWLAKWSQGAQSATISRAQLTERGLSELATTPILLFMIAFTWARHAGDEGVISKALLYEQFFRQLARGKAEGDREQHKPIREASEKLLVVLQQNRELDEGAGPVDAMLWLMSRVAWEALRLEQTRQRALRKSDVQHLLETELEPAPPDEVVELIQFGLVLALQANLRSGNTTILFGHQSFREFLVARYWSQELLRIVRDSDGDWHKAPARLLGARLLGHEDRSFEFLMQFINQKEAPTDSVGTWTGAYRNKLVRWAERTFNDETLQKASGKSVTLTTTLREDERFYLREAALAIGSTTTNSAGLGAEDPNTLRSLLASFWMRQVSAIVKARGFKAPKAQLEGVNLMSSNFREADLQQADLQQANLIASQLLSANLQQANLTGAHLVHANLTSANLLRANLRFVTLIAANLQHANLSNANLEHANLSNANLQHANLSNANLNNADLRHVHLAGADLRGANLDGTQLITPPEDFNPRIYPPAAIFDDTTLWPEGFVPPEVPPEQIDQDRDDDETDDVSGSTAD